MLIQLSEVDLKDNFDNYCTKESVEKLFKRPVDLVENQAIKNPVFRQVVDKEKQIVFLS